MISYSKQDLRQRQLLDISEVIETASRHHFLLPSRSDSDDQRKEFFLMMFYGERWTINVLSFLWPRVAAGCSTLTRNAVTHGLDPEVWKLLKIGNIRNSFWNMFVAHGTVLYYGIMCGSCSAFVHFMHSEAASFAQMLFVDEWQA